MTDILCFSRNLCTSIEQVDDRTIRSTCRVQDNLMDAFVEILVSLPDLEIVGAGGGIKRCREPLALDDLQKITGTRVGPGIKKIIGSLIEDLPYSEQVAVLLDECCNGVILSFTKDVLSRVPKEKLGEKGYFAGIVKANPRLYNSCAALSPDSPLMEGVEPEEK